MKIDIEKEYVKINNEIFYFNNIKNIEFKENKNNIKEKIMTLLFYQLSTNFIFLILIIPFFFYKNWTTIILASIGIIFTLKDFFTKKPKYEICIENRKIYYSDNKKEFEEIKEKILKR